MEVVFIMSLSSMMGSALAIKAVFWIAVVALLIVILKKYLSKNK